MLTVLPTPYVADIYASSRFCAGLGPACRPEAAVDVWAHLDAGAGAVGIHDAVVSQGRPPGTTELGSATDVKPEDVAERLVRSGDDHTLVDEDVGRSIRVTAPDGVVVRIQEINHVTVRRSAAAVGGAPA